MSNTKEHLKNRFIARCAKEKTALPFIRESIKTLDTVDSESNPTKAVEEFLSTVSKYEVNEEVLNTVKQILNEFIANQITQNEALAYLNYILDVTYFKSEHLLRIKDIFDCYF